MQAGNITKPRGEDPTKPSHAHKRSRGKDFKSRKSQFTNTNSNAGGPISRAPPRVERNGKEVPPGMEDFFNNDPELSVKVEIKDEDEQDQPSTSTGERKEGTSGSLRNRKVYRNGDGDVSQSKENSGRRRGNVNFLQMAASLISVIDRVTSVIPLFGGDGPRGDLSQPESKGSENSEDTQHDSESYQEPNIHEDPIDPEEEEKAYLKSHPRGIHPIFRAEIGGDVRDPLDYSPEMEKFNIRSDWRRSVLAPSFRSDVGYVELPTGIVDEALVWMQTHWKKYPTPEERTILMQELNSTCAMLLRKFNVRPSTHYSRVEEKDNFINPDFSHQVHGLGALAIDVGEPLFFASQHPIPVFHKGWPLATFITFVMLVAIVSLSQYLPLNFGLFCILLLLFLLWVFGSLSISKNKHWYYYAFSPELRFQFGSRR